MLSAEAVRWRVAVEAQGWELMLHFAGLGIGLAVVNGACRLPDGLVGLPLQGMPGVRYFILHRPNGLEFAGAAALKELLLETAEHWRGA